MRTTLSLLHDAWEVIRAYAKQRLVSMGKAAPELVRRGGRHQAAIRMVDGFAVFDVPEDFPVITKEQVRKLLDEE